MARTLPDEGNYVHGHHKEGVAILQQALKHKRCESAVSRELEFTRHFMATQKLVNVVDAATASKVKLQLLTISNGDQCSRYEGVTTMTTYFSCDGCVPCLCQQRSTYCCLWC